MLPTRLLSKWNTLIEMPPGFKIGRHIHKLGALGEFVFDKRDRIVYVAVLGRLESIRSAKKFNYRSRRIRDLRIRGESDRWVTALYVIEALSYIEDLVASIRKGEVLAVRAEVCRNAGAIDQDNLDASINKLIIDGLVRRGSIKSDAKSKIRQYPATLRLRRNVDERVSLMFTVEPLEKKQEGDSEWIEFRNAWSR